MARKTHDLLDGITDRSTKPELMERLRDGAALLRRSDRQRKARVQEIEDRIRAKGTVNTAVLQQVIVSASDEEWKEAIEFLEEFDDLLPISLQRLVLGGRTLLGQIAAEGAEVPV